MGNSELEKCTPAVGQRIRWNLRLRTQGSDKPENSTIALFCVDFVKDANTWAGSLVNSAGVSLFNVRNKV